MKATLAVLAMLVAMSQAQAQSIQYDEATNTVVETKPAPAAQVVAAPVTIVQSAAPTAVQAPAPAPAPVAAPAALAPASTSQSTAITVVTPSQVVAAPTAQSLGMQAQAVQEPAPTVIEGQPLKDSRSELLHKARGQMEDHTEKKIVEKLEEARIRDEKKRSDRFNQAIDISENPVLAPTPVAPVAPVGVAPLALQPEVVVPVAPVVVPGNSKEEVKVERNEVEDVKIETKSGSDENVKPVAREELRSDMSRLEDKKEDKGQMYIGAVGGLADYPGATNLKANGMGGFNVGYVTKNRIVIEGGFGYSSFDLQDNYNLYSQYPPYKNLDQYNMTLALKYEILPGTFRPFAGVLAGYTRRNYSNPSQAYNAAPGTTQNASSDSIDYGFTVGLDVLLTSNLSIGADFKYLTNLSNRVDSAYQKSYQSAQYSQTTPVEELDYYTVGVSAKLMF